MDFMGGDSLVAKKGRGRNEWKENKRRRNLKGLDHHSVWDRLTPMAEETEDNWEKITTITQ